MTVVKLMTADHDDWEPGHKSGISASSTIFYLSHRWGDIKSVLCYIESHTDERSYRTDYRARGISHHILDQQHCTI